MGITGKGFRTGATVNGRVQKGKSRDPSPKKQKADGSRFPGPLLLRGSHPRQRLERYDADSFSKPKNGPPKKSCRVFSWRPSKTTKKRRAGGGGENPVLRTTQMPSSDQNAVDSDYIGSPQASEPKPQKESAG